MGKTRRNWKSRMGEQVKRRGKVRYRLRKSGKPDKFRFNPRDY